MLRRTAWYKFTNICTKKSEEVSYVKIRLTFVLFGHSIFRQEEGLFSRGSVSGCGTTAAPNGRIVMIMSVDTAYQRCIWTHHEWRTDCVTEATPGSYPFYNKEEVKMTTRESSLTGVKKKFQKFWDQVNILGSRKVTWSKFHIEDPQILGASKHNVVDRATWRPGIVHFRRWMQKPDLCREGNFNSQKY